MTVKGIGFIITLGILLGSLAAQAQQTGNVYRIGFLGNSTAALEANLVGPFREGLRDFGYHPARKRVALKSRHRGDDPFNEQIRVVHRASGDVGPYRLDVLDRLW